MTSTAEFGEGNRDRKNNISWAICIWNSVESSIMFSMRDPIRGVVVSSFPGGLLCEPV